MHILLDFPPCVFSSSAEYLKIPSHYLRNVSARSSYTLKSYAGCLVHWLSWCERKQVDWTTVTEIKILEYMRGLNICQRTKNYRISRLSAFYRYAEEHGVKNPFGPHSTKLKRYLRPVNSTRPHLPSLGDVGVFIRALPMPYQLMARLIALTGLRRSEVINLRRKDLKARAVQGVTPLTIVGKGRRKRTVYVLNHLLEELLNHSGDGFVFSHHHRAYTPEAVNNQFAKTAKQCGINVTPHLLRHVYATYRLKTLVSSHDASAVDAALKIVQVELGHSKVTTTQIYIDILALVSSISGREQLIAEFHKNGMQIVSGESPQ